MPVRVGGCISTTTSIYVSDAMMRHTTLFYQIKKNNKKLRLESVLVPVPVCPPCHFHVACG